jgi:drug/metabolite transporter superfamily protein YnfA
MNSPSIELTKGYIVEILIEFWQFLKERKKWWLLPMIVVLLLVGLLITLTSGTAVAPFIYTLF